MVGSASVETSHATPLLLMRSSTHRRRPRLPSLRLDSLVLAALALACSEPDEMDLEIRGTITDAETGAPVPGASVSLLWSPELYDIEAVGTESGTDGGYLLTVFKLPCDRPLLLVSLEPYQPEQRDVRCTEDPQRFDVALRR